MDADRCIDAFSRNVRRCFRREHSGQSAEKGIVSLNAVNFRDYANNKHNTVDDYPYGGGGGMVLKPEPLFAAVEDLTPESGIERPALY